MKKKDDSVCLPYDSNLDELLFAPFSLDYASLSILVDHRNESSNFFCTHVSSAHFSHCSRRGGWGSSIMNMQTNETIARDTIRASKVPSSTWRILPDDVREHAGLGQETLFWESCHHDGAL
jgi:hypothetical protein